MEIWSIPRQKLPTSQLGQKHCRSGVLPCLLYSEQSDVSVSVSVLLFSIASLINEIGGLYETMACCSLLYSLEQGCNALLRRGQGLSPTRPASASIPVTSTFVLD